MREVTACPHCGASMQYRRPNGDIACAYCDCIIAMAEVEAAQPRYNPYPFDMFDGTFRGGYGGGTVSFGRC